LVLARGGKTWPLWGFTDVHAAMTGKPFGKRGQFRGFVGEGLVVFGKWQNGKLQSAEAIHQYGSSNKPNSPHYADQVEMYLKHQTRPVTLEMDEIRRTAVRSYHPGQPATTAPGSSTAPLAPVR
jgi:acyl-homoserine-lactone acylase